MLPCQVLLLVDVRQPLTETCPRYLNNDRYRIEAEQRRDMFDQGPSFSVTAIKFGPVNRRGERGGGRNCSTGAPEPQRHPDKVNAGCMLPRR
jgi:hypothetical protein